MVFSSFIGARKASVGFVQDGRLCGGAEEETPQTTQVCRAASVSRNSLYCDAMVYRQEAHFYTLDGKLAAVLCFAAPISYNKLPLLTYC